MLIVEVSVEVWIEVVGRTAGASHQLTDDVIYHV